MTRIIIRSKKVRREGLIGDEKVEVTQWRRGFSSIFIGELVRSDG